MVSPSLRPTPYLDGGFSSLLLTWESRRAMIPPPIEIAGAFEGTLFFFLLRTLSFPPEKSILDRGGAKSGEDGDPEHDMDIPAHNAQYARGRNQRLWFLLFRQHAFPLCTAHFTFLGGTKYWRTPNCRGSRVVSEALQTCNNDSLRMQAPAGQFRIFSRGL